MRDEEDVAVAAEEPPQLRLPAGPLLAAVVVEDGAEWSAAGGPVDESVKREPAVVVEDGAEWSAAGGPVDESVKREPAAGEGNFFRLRGGSRRGNEAERERPASRALRLLQFGQQLLQLARLVHLAHDVGAPDEFAVDVELRNGRPVGEFLDALADLRVGEHVHRGFSALAAGVEHLHRERGKAALRHLRRAFHEEHYRVALDLLLDALLGIHRGHFTCPPETRGIPAKSGQVATSSRPFSVRSERTATSCPTPCSSMSHPPGTRWDGAAATIR